MIPNQEVRQLSRKFGIRTIKMQIVQNGVYHIVTTKGHEYCLKRMPYPPVRLRWIDQTLQQLRRKGSIRVGWRNPSDSSGKRLFVKRQYYDSPPFVLIPWLRGAWPSPHSRKQMRACGTLLAKFHQAGKTIKFAKSGSQNMMGTWPSHLLQEQNSLRNIIRKAKNNAFHSTLDQLLQRHGDEILQLARDSLRTLRKSNYKSICRKTKATLCHGDCGPSNIIRTKRGMYWIDFETLRLDLRTYDIYRMIFNSCQYNNWDFAIARSILNGYQKVYKLSHSDFKMLHILLRFPRGICKLLVHYDLKSPQDKTQIERDFPKILAHERRRSTFLKKLDSYMK